MNSKYKRILLKISGESLAAEKRHGFSSDALASTAKQIATLAKNGVEVGVVVGGGNFWRGREGDEMDRTTADYMGMLSTVLNALAIFDQASERLNEQIKSISAASAVKTSLTLKGGVEVAFGVAEDMELKEADIWTLLDKHEGKISYINVRVPDRPTYRTSTK